MTTMTTQSRAPTVGDTVTLGHGVRAWFVQSVDEQAGTAAVTLLDGTETYEATTETVPLTRLHAVEES